MLNEEDVLFGLWKRRGVADETRAALSCIQHGLLQPGQDYLLDAIRRAATNQFPPMSAGAAFTCLYIDCLESASGTCWEHPRIRQTAACGM